MDGFYPKIKFCPSLVYDGMKKLESTNLKVFLRVRVKINLSLGSLSQSLDMRTTSFWFCWEYWGIFQWALS